MVTKYHKFVEFRHQPCCPPAHCPIGYVSARNRRYRARLSAESWMRTAEVSYAGIKWLSDSTRFSMVAWRWSIYDFNNSVILLFLFLKYFWQSKFRLITFAHFLAAYLSYNLVCWLPVYKLDGTNSFILYSCKFTYIMIKWPCQMSYSLRSLIKAYVSDSLWVPQ